MSLNRHSIKVKYQLRRFWSSELSSLSLSQSQTKIGYAGVTLQCTICRHYESRQISMFWSSVDRPCCHQALFPRTARVMRITGRALEIKF